MDEARRFLDMPSPPNSYQYLFGDHDHYFEANHSESHSSATSLYDAKISGDFAGTSVFPSPESREADDGCESPLETTASGEIVAHSKAVPKRKRENRYKNAPPSVLSRRRAQNRASQRAYRERKDQRIKDLEQLLNDARVRNDILSHAYAELHAEYIKLKSSPSPSPSSNLDVHNSHSHRHQLSSSVATSYVTIPGSSVPVDLNGSFLDSTSIAVLNHGSDLESYLYSNIGGYAL